MTAPMSPADRAALAARLRAEAGTLLSSISTRAECGFPVISARAHADDLLAAAAELKRPRPRAEWRVEGGHAQAVTPGVAGPAEVAVVFFQPKIAPCWFYRVLGSDAFGAFSLRGAMVAATDHLLAAGFDVAPLPEVSDAG